MHHLQANRTLLELEGGQRAVRFVLFAIGAAAQGKLGGLMLCRRLGSGLQLLEGGC